MLFDQASFSFKGLDFIRCTKRYFMFEIASFDDRCMAFVVVLPT